MGLIATWRSEDPFAPVWRASAWTAIAIIVSGLAFWFTLVRAPEDLAASRDRGIRGTFTVTSSTCNRGCTTDGAFISANGRVRAGGVRFRSSDYLPVGRSVDGQFFHGPYRSVYPIDPSPWHTYSVVSAVMALYLPFLAWCWIARPGRAFLSWNFNMHRWVNRIRDEARRETGTSTH